MKYPCYTGYGFERRARPMGWGPLARFTYQFENVPARDLKRDFHGHWWRWELWSKDEDRWVPLEGPDAPQPTGELKDVREDPTLERVKQLNRYERYRWP